MLDQFLSAEPFPHLVIDNFAPEATLRAVAAAFEEVPDEAWVRYDDLDECGKRACNRWEAIPVVCRGLLSVVSSPMAATICQWLTGIDGLVSDPTLYGGGLHETAPGGFLGVHLDNERHPTTGLARRLNLIVYCTDWSAAGGWRDEWGGQFELWDRTC
ncbi:MAG: 2OG-Fe(II) oxygenase, partial [Pirellulales bacterium]